MQQKGGGEESADALSRLLATAPYLLPLVDGVDYGQYVYSAVPPLGEAVYGVLGSTIALWRTVPFVGLGVFIALTVVSRRPNLPRFIRFNIQQAILLDIGLVVSNLLSQGIRFVIPAAAEPFTTLIFYCLTASLGYVIYSNVQGKAADQIPVISRAAQAQIGPY